MSQENVEVVIGIFEAVNARDFATALDAYAEDAKLVIHADVGPLETTATGKGAVGEWFGDWFRQFGVDYRFEINEARDCGDRVFLVATHHGRGRVSGVPVTLRHAYIYTLREGKVWRIEVWADTKTALEAAGLRE